MKFLFYSVIVLFPAANSLAQAPIRDTSKTTLQNASIADDTGSITIRGRRGECYYYIDGIKVRDSANRSKTSLQEIGIIIGGIPVTYGDGIESTIGNGKAPVTKTSRKTMDKVENMATQ